MTVAEQTQYVETMRRLLADADRLIEASSTDADARQGLASTLDMAASLVSLQTRRAHRPQIDALSPPSDD